MSLVFAAISPHPPLLIPAIGKEEIKKIDKTKEALERLEEDLYLAKPDVILVISPHGSFFKDAFTIDFCPEYETDLREFGDISTKLNFKADTAFSSGLYEASKKNKIPLTAICERILDHGAVVPLFYLTKHLPKVNIVPIGFCNLDWKTHTDFGYMIKEEIMNSNRRIAVIASGDLSHALTTDAPAGFNPAGAEFDQKIQELLSTHNTVGMLQMDEKFLDNAAECGFRSFLILMGILRNVKYDFKLYSYESPFGVGYLTANFVL